MTSKIVVNNIQTDAGISSVTLLSHIAGHDSTQNISGINSVTANAFYGSGANLTGIDSTKIETGNTKIETIDTGSDGHIKATTEGSERLRITSAGNIGINDNNPANQLVVKAPGGSGHCTAKVLSGDASTTVFLQSVQGTEGRLGVESNHSLAIYAGAAERLKISSLGHVTKPANPSFRATASSALDYTSDNTLQFQNEKHDVGGYYNNSNSYYTIPTTGYYKFEVMHFAQPGQIARVQLERSTDSGSSWSIIQIGPRIESSGGGRYIAGWMHVFHEFTATNLVRVRWSQGNVHINNGYGWFQGWLVQ